MVKSSPKFSVLLFAILGLAAAGLILYATTWGPVIFSDAAGYLTVARNILAGHGIGLYEASGQFTEMTIQPPFFSLLLAFLGLSGVDVVILVRWLHAFLWGLVIFLSGLGLLRLTSSGVLALAGAVSILVSPLLLNLFTQAMSEPTFIALSVLAALCLLRALVRAHRGWLAVAAVCVGLAAITRFVGVAWMISGTLMVLIFWQAGWKRRLGALLIFGGLSVFPLTLLMAWVMFIVQVPFRVSESNVNLAQRLIEVRLAFVDIFWAWLPFSASLPELHYRVIMLILLSLLGLSITIVVLSTGWVMRKRSGAGWLAWLQEPLVQVTSLLVVSLLAYLGVIAVGYAYSNPMPDLNDRTLVMGQLIGLGLTFVACGAIYRAWPTQLWRHALPLVCVGVIVTSGWQQSVKMLQDDHQFGNGYLGQRWQLSATRLAAMQLPADMPLISNEFSALAFWTGRPVYPMNEVVALNSQPVDARFGDDTSDDVQRAFRQQGAALIIFDTIRWQLDPLYFEQTPARLESMTRGLTVYGDYADGAIYFYP